MNKRKTYDFLLIGGGLFGVYSALYLAKKGYRICLLEKEDGLFRKASLVNQARLHSGYHYPRSVATALMSDDNKERFFTDHQDFINSHFKKYYAIDKYGSFTDPFQFERFCAYISIPAKRVYDHPLFNFQRIEALYETEEYSFDPMLIASYYQEKLKSQEKIDLHLGVEIHQAETEGDHWVLSFGNDQSLKAKSVINATYAGSNGINRLFGLETLRLLYEISEIALISCPELKDIGLTVMDGQYGSIMPFGKSGLLSVSSVAYTHHKVSYDPLPSFDCQQKNPLCRPDFLSDCNHCPARPVSNQRKMLNQMRQYFSETVGWQYYQSLFTVKTKLKANFIDDGRPTEINCLHENPHFYCIFAGKINSIYEIEKVI